MFWTRKPKGDPMQAIITALIRHALTLGGGAGLLSDDQATQAASALATLIGLAWSLIPKIREMQRKTV